MITQFVTVNLQLNCCCILANSIVAPINLRSSHVFSQWLSLISGAYVPEINKHKRMDTTLNALLAFRLFSTRYFGICQFFLRYCGIGYSPMSPSYSNSKAITKGRTTRSSPDSHCLEKKQA